MEAVSTRSVWSAGLSFSIAWAVQALVAYFVLLASLLLLAGRIDEPDTVFWNIANYVFSALIGLALGVSVSLLIPASAESGRWVWAGPVGLLVLCAVWEICVGRFDIVTLWFGTGEAGWISSLVTLPALGCCGYSAAMEMTRRMRNQRPD